MRNSGATDAVVLNSDLLATHGIDLTFADVVCEPESKLLSYSSQRVILFRRQRVASVADLNALKPFHLSWCDALDRNAQQVPAARHTYTTRLDRLFPMTILSKHDGPSDYAIELAPCKICLSHLNYRGYRTGNREEKEAIREAFSLSEFFEMYRVSKGTVTTVTMEPVRLPNEYPIEWPEISRAVRRAANWTCSECGVQCNTSKELLHTHHVNGIKSDLRLENLRALCMTCHSRKPGHQTMYISPMHRSALRSLREQQGIPQIPEL